MRYKEIKKRLENYNNKYMTNEEIIELMKAEIEYYKQQLKIKDINKADNIKSIITTFYADGQTIKEERVYYK